VDLVGNHATAAVADDVSRLVEIPMVRERGRWKMDAVFGTPVNEAHATAASIRRDPFPPALGPAVRAFGTDGAPCPSIDLQRYPSVKGGCRVRSSFATVSFQVLTVFGRFELAKCSIRYALRVDRRGRTVTEGVDVEYAPDLQDDACGDVNQCIRRSGQTGKSSAAEGTASLDGSR
jgi:hypothetical protein